MEPHLDTSCSDECVSGVVWELSNWGPGLGGVLEAPKTEDSETHEAEVESESTGIFLGLTGGPALGHWPLASVDYIIF